MYVAVICTANYKLSVSIMTIRCCASTIWIMLVVDSVAVRIVRCVLKMMVMMIMIAVTLGYCVE